MTYYLHPGVFFLCDASIAFPNAASVSFRVPWMSEIFLYFLTPPILDRTPRSKYITLVALYEKYFPVTFLCENKSNHMHQIHLIYLKNIMIIWNDCLLMQTINCEEKSVCFSWCCYSCIYKNLICYRNQRGVEKISRTAVFEISQKCNYTLLIGYVCVNCR